MYQTTTNMCKMGTGRVGFARVLIDVKAKRGLPDKIDIVYKKRDGAVTGQKSVKVEYDWSPPICSFCKVFGHCDKNCGCRPKTAEELVKMEKAELRRKQENTEFEQVEYKRRGIKNVNQNAEFMKDKEGGKISKVIYKPIEKGDKINMGKNDGHDVFDSIRKNANKYAVLDEDNEIESLLTKGKEVDNEVIDVCEETSGFARKMSQNKIGSSLGKVSKQNAVKNLIVDEKLNICAGLETKIKGINVKKVGDRIQYMIFHASDQAVLCLFEILSTNGEEGGWIIPDVH
ncbi:hypothetical protein Tco_0267013 [Tanacetum coccineum]